jgi:hypothetical protein
VAVSADACVRRGLRVEAIDGAETDVVTEVRIREQQQPKKGRKNRCPSSRLSMEKVQATGAKTKKKKTDGDNSGG